MMVDGADFEISGRVASIRLTRPERQNLLTKDILETLGDIAQALHINQDVDVLTITSVGTASFSSGILTPELRKSLGKLEVLALIRLANTVFDAIEALPQIVIAGLNGAVRAGAVELALACDYRIAGDHVTWASPEARWGGFPGVGAPVRLPMAVGLGRAVEILCTGREIGATELERIGLVESIVPRDDVGDAMNELAKAIAENGPLATRGIKKIARTRLSSGFGEARKVSDELRAALEWTDDIDEGIAAAIEMRKPHFTGR